MKVRYDVDVWSRGGNHSMRFTDQREAFELAKKCAAQDATTVFMVKYVWDEKGAIKIAGTVEVKADGTFVKVN